MKNGLYLSVSTNFKILGQKSFNFLHWLFGKIKTPKSHSEIIWPLDGYILMDPNPYFFFFAGVIIYVFESFHFNADWYNYLFPVFLYPFAEIAQCSSIYMTVAIAVERFIGLCRPFRRLSSRPCPAKAYILPGNQEVFVLLTIDWNISWRSILILMWLEFSDGKHFF